MVAKILLLSVVISALTGLGWSLEALPFVVLHGIGDQCSNTGMTHFVQDLSKWSGAKGTCIEIGDGAGDSWTMQLYDQVDEVCRQVRAMKELEKGFNLVGLSQGNIIGRGYIEFCDGGPPVHNFVSIGGPHAGTASVPLCRLHPVCRVIDYILELGIYSPYVQNHIAPTGYVKIPMDLAAYRRGCLFLPYINNELEGSRNATYKARFAALNFLTLIMFDSDSVLVPPETAWFGFFEDGSLDKILLPQKTDLYKHDWIGLKTLDDAGKVSYVRAPGNHLAITDSLIVNHILPYIKATSKVIPRVDILRSSMTSMLRGAFAVTK